MSALDLRGIHIQAYAPPDSFAYRRRRDRAARVRRAVLRPEIALLVLASVLAALLGASNGFEAARVIAHFLGAN